MATRAKAMQRSGSVLWWVMKTQRRTLTVTAPAAPSYAGAMPLPVLCGRGDKKTKRGKRFKGSYGNSRPKREKMIERIKDKVEVPRSTPWPLPFKLI
ncbi:30S ribosomal protein S31, mitochondrial-like [Prosopis cineraria]|uniref:30S ribosomal protein S31, mitochondrial-like n=1 Tax=Prosopis cineraria TaxID=364024 RepID=UPI00240FB238|nr:30S ribosomal protein S31, mitochondrial-like [Prosopis cineraria]